jgi:hypothetical protein
MVVERRACASAASRRYMAYGATFTEIGVWRSCNDRHPPAHDDAIDAGPIGRAHLRRASDQSGQPCADDGRASSAVRFLKNLAA